MALNREDWVLHARRYVVTLNTDHLQDALACCEDPLVGEYLSVAAEGNPYEYEWAADALRDQSRTKEAAIVEIIGSRPPGRSLRSGLFGGPVAHGEIEKLIELAHVHEFSDCAAYFHALLGVDLSEDKANDSAIFHLTRAAELYRPFVGSQPDLYQPELAGALNSLGITLFQKGSHASSEAAYREALDHWKQVDGRGHGAHQGDIANVLNNLGNTLKAQRRLKDAQESLTDALAIRRALAAENPQYEHYVATTLNNLGNVLRENRRFDDALSALTEARTIRVRLAEKNPRRFSRAVATTVRNIAAVYQEQREFELARGESEAALYLLQQAADDDPQLQNDEIPGLHLNLGVINRAEERWDEAIQHLRAAEHAYRRALARGRGTDTAGGLSSVLEELAQSLLKKGDLPAARNHFQEALSIREHQTSAQPGSHRKEYADCLNSYGLLLHAEQEDKDAVTYFARAADLYDALRSDEPASHSIGMAMALGNLTLAFAADGDPRWRTTCETAIRAAEASEASVDQLWLSKGYVGGCYSLLAKRSLESGDTDQAFRCLAALRRPSARVFDSDECDPAAAALTLRRIEAEIGRKIRIVVAHQMSVGSEGSLLGLLQTESPFFQVVHDTDFHADAFMILQEAGSAFEPDDRRSFEVRYERFNICGERAWSSAPRFIRDVLEPDEDCDVLISGDAFWNVFPWDALKKPNGSGGWIGRERVLPRWSDVTSSGLVGLKRCTLGERDRSAAVVCPWNAVATQPLNRAQDEARNISTIFLERGYTLLPDPPLFGDQATATGMRELLLHAPTVLHFSGHGTTRGNEPALVLWDNDRRSPALLSRHGIAHVRTEAEPLNLAAPGGLVTLNACLSGRPKAFGGQREDLPSAFLEAGASVVVSSAFPISDTLGSAFGRQLYERGSTSNESLSTQFLRARALVEHAARQKKSPYWASWSLFTYSGNPYAILP